MPRCFPCLVLALACAFAVQAAEPPKSFSRTLTADQKQRLGLSGLSASQLEALDAAVAAYTRGEAEVAVSQAVQTTERAAEAKVRAAEQKAQVAEKKAAQAAGSAVAELKKRQEDDSRESFTARVVGPFRGWSGGTYFPLDNGQVWRQVGAESYELPVVRDASVEIFRSKSGYWRLRYEGAWITVKRLQ